MLTPVVLVTGVDPDAMATTTVGLQFGLPGAVAVRHHIDVERQVLTRTVSDLSGVLEQHEITLEHACVSCAIREDVLPTIERLARAGRWQGIVVHLPVGGEAGQVCWVLARETRFARLLRVSAVVAALSTQDPVAHGLVRTLARPDATIVSGASDLDDAALTGGLHQHSRTEAWTAPTRTHDLPVTGAEGVWQLDLRASRPFHPGRLLDSLEQLGTGPHRSRGCFWLPSRPGRIIAWDGAGGQLSIGHHGPWGDQVPFTRIVMTGVGVAPAHARSAFAAMLVHPSENRPERWGQSEDGFEPWLGPVRDAA